MFLELADQLAITGADLVLFSLQNLQELRAKSWMQQEEGASKAPKIKKGAGEKRRSKSN
jgi:methionyl-tRNA formyltransferase